MNRQGQGQEAWGKRWLLVWLLGLAAVMAVGAGGSARAAAGDSTWPYANETKEERDARMAWWREAKFGMFIHWGVYSVPAGTYNDKRIGWIGEWIMHRAKIPVAEYKAYAKEFNPVKYDADAWVRLAKEAGMKYIVITSKHHDGFALFDSKVTDWDVVDATPYGKDLLKPLAAACKRHGVKLGFYYSQAQDWCHVGGAKQDGAWDEAQKGDMDKYIQEIAMPQVAEILAKYEDLAVLWWDTPTNMTKERADMLQPLVRLRPGIITNNRLGGGYPGDLRTPEQHIPATGLPGDWETCMTINDTWGFKSYDDNWKSTEMLLQNLVDIASKGGNYLLNVGPTSEGEIPAASIERLKAIGKWMKVNSESIYGTSANPFSKVTWGRVTKKVRADGARLYVHVFDWPGDGQLLLPGLKNEVAKAYVLANGKKLRTERVKAGVVLQVPKKAVDEIDTVLVADVKGPLDVEKVLQRQEASGSLTLKAVTADLHSHHHQLTIETKGGMENIGYWVDEQAWVEWTFLVDNPGLFEVTAELAGPSASTFEVLVGDEKLTVAMEPTGAYDKFENKALGQVTIEQAGKVTLAVKPVAGKWQAVNLRKVVLEPAK